MQIPLSATLLALVAAATSAHAGPVVAARQANSSTPAMPSAANTSAPAMPGAANMSTPAMPSAANSSAPGAAAGAPTTPARNASTPPSFFNASSQAGPYGLDNYSCSDPANVSVPINSTNFRFSGVNDSYATQEYVTRQLLQLATNMTAWTKQYANGTFNYQTTLQIATRLCQPNQGARDNASLVVATHGIGFDSSYWTFDYDPSYNFVRHATSYGYPVLVYDRQGTGNSSTPTEGGWNNVQAPVEINVLTYLLQQARNTTTFGNRQWNRTTVVGHSYGSAISQAVALNSPQLVDGVVLTGFSTSTAGFAQYLTASTYSIANSVADLVRLRSKPSIWLATASNASQLLEFFAPPYEDGALALARNTEQPVTMGAFATIGNVNKPAANYTAKPVAVVNGNADAIFCATLTNGPNCSAVQPAGSQDNSTDFSQSVTSLFPRASSFDAYNVPSVGHGISAHPGASQAYEFVAQWLVARGL